MFGRTTLPSSAGSGIYSENPPCHMDRSEQSSFSSIDKKEVPFEQIYPPPQQPLLYKTVSRENASLNITTITFSSQMPNVTDRTYPHNLHFIYPFTSTQLYSANLYLELDLVLCDLPY